MADVLDAGDFEHDRRLIRDRYLSLLGQDGSPLMAGEQVVAQVLGQLDSVIDATYRRLDLLIDRAGSDDLGLSARIGESRAIAGVHPAQSLRAASLIFEAALPVVGERLAHLGRSQPDRAAASTLNQEIMARMSVAAGSYIGFLLDRIHRSNRDERRRLSRDLHDVVAPAVAVGLQNLDLYDVYSDQDLERAQTKLDLARQAMHEALTAMRSLSAESRESVGRDGLEYALATVLERGPVEIDTRLTVSGDLTALPGPYAEELFLLVREAVRNAFSHARPTRIEVDLGIDDFEVIGGVRDDGIGFESDRNESPGRGVGLTSMRERAELLGGSLVVDSSLGNGTIVRAQIPLPPPSLRLLRTDSDTADAGSRS